MYMCRPEGTPVPVPYTGHASATLLWLRTMSRSPHPALFPVLALLHSMRTALILQHYEDILDPVDVQSLIAIASFHNSYLGTCSKAFMQLESNEALSPAQREEYAALALSIFMQHSPEDPSAESPFDRDVRPRKYCIVSGRPVKDSRFWRCKECSHIAILAEIRGISFCPLCHAAT